MRSGCWSKALGDSEGKLSGEHLVSAGIWTGPKILVSGGPWGEETLEIGVANLTSKVLCRKHNSDLSVVDDAGIAAFKALTRSASLALGRMKLKPFGFPEWMPCWFGIDGPLLERWFLKTAINMCCVLRAPDERQWEFGGSAGDPPLRLVRGAFGLDEIPKPLGLYIQARVGDAIGTRATVYCEPLFSMTQRISAMSFEFHGIAFVINMAPTRILGLVSSPAHHEVKWSAGDLLYHLIRINQNVGPYRSHYVDCRWPGRQFDYFGPDI